MQQTIRITDQTTALQIQAYLNVMCFHAKRAQRVIGTAEYPSEWDRCHAKIDSLLGDWIERQSPS